MGRINWIHPSYRDLIIEEIEKNRELRLTYLRNAGVEDIKLALSDTGGISGKRNLPFIIDSESKSILSSRISNISNTLSSGDLWTLIIILVNSVQIAPDLKMWIIDCLKTVLKTAQNNWSKENVPVIFLETYSKASIYINPLPPLPEVGHLWKHFFTNFSFEIEQGTISNFYEITNLFEFIEFALENEPRFLKQINFPSEQDQIFQRLIEILEEDLYYEPILISADEIQDEIDHLNELVKGLLKISKFLPEKEDQINKIINVIRDDKIVELEEKLPPIDNDDFNVDDEYDSVESFEIETLFSDL